MSEGFDRAARRAARQLRVEADAIADTDAALADLRAGRDRSGAMRRRGGAAPLGTFVRASVAVSMAAAIVAVLMVARPGRLATVDVPASAPDGAFDADRDISAGAQARVARGAAKAAATAARDAAGAVAVDGDAGTTVTIASRAGAAGDPSTADDLGGGPGATTVLDAGQRVGGIDFWNKTYTLPGWTPIVVVDGHGSDSGDPCNVRQLDVRRAWVAGLGRVDSRSVVVDVGLVCNGDTSETALVYAIDSGTPRFVAASDDVASGTQVRRITVDGPDLVVERFDAVAGDVQSTSLAGGAPADGASTNSSPADVAVPSGSVPQRGSCCPSRATEQRTQFDGSRLVEVGSRSRAVAASLDSGELHFLPGTSGASIAIGPGASLSFEARAGQVLHLEIPNDPGRWPDPLAVSRDGNGAGVAIEVFAEVNDPSAGSFRERLGTVVRGPATEIVLPYTGRYQLTSRPEGNADPVLAGAIFVVAEITIR